MNRQRVFFVGLGNLGSYMFDLFVRIPGHPSFLVGGRDLEHLKERTNLSVFAATQLGYQPQVTCTTVDLWNVEQTAELLARFRPDMIVCAATLQQTEAIHDLPTLVSERLASAQMGPRLPLHLALIYRLMQAIHMTGLSVIVLNAIYPDVVGPVLQRVGLAPTTGIGDLANNIPALRQSMALELQMPVEDMDVRLILARYVSYWMSRRPLEEDVPYHFTPLVKNKEWFSPLDLRNIARPLFTTLKRSGGTIGLLMTAASAFVVFHGIIHNTGAITHAPGPDGLPGGYPIQVQEAGVRLALPDGLSLEEALHINEEGLRLDGIERIEPDGTVYFTEKNMSILKETLGYECRQMKLSDVGEWANELQAKYAALVKKYA